MIGYCVPSSGLWRNVRSAFSPLSIRTRKHLSFFPLLLSNTFCWVSDRYWSDRDRPSRSCPFLSARYWFDRQSWVTGQSKVHVWLCQVLAQFGLTVLSDRWIDNLLVLGRNSFLLFSPMSMWTTTVAAWSRRRLVDVCCGFFLSRLLRSSPALRTRRKHAVIYLNIARVKRITVLTGNSTVSVVCAWYFVIFFSLGKCC